jgi:hypothetical protein
MAAPTKNVDQQHLQDDAKPQGKKICSAFKVGEKACLEPAALPLL